MLEALQKESTYTIFVYSNLRRELLELPVSPEFTVGDVLALLIKAFDLPSAERFHQEKIVVELAYYLVRGDSNECLPLNDTLENLGIKKGAVVTFWKQLQWRDAEGRTTDASMMEFKQFSLGEPSKNDRSRAALDKFKARLSGAWDEAITRLAAAESESATLESPNAPRTRGGVG